MAQLDLAISNPGACGSADRSASDGTLFAVLVPLAIDERLAVRPDEGTALAYRLETGEDWTLLLISAAPLDQVIHLSFREIDIVEPAPGNRLIIALNLDYASLPANQRRIVERDSSVRLWDIEIELPGDYDTSEIRAEPDSLEKRDDSGMHTLSAEEIRAVALGRAWIAFPDPQEEASQSNLLIVAFAVGVVTLVGDWRAVKRDQLRAILVLLLASVSAVGYGLWSFFAGPRSFLVLFTAFVCAPHVPFSLCATVYLLYARARRVTLEGPVQIEYADGRVGPAHHAKVYVFRDTTGGRIELGETRSSKGWYSLSFWLGVRRPRIPDELRIGARTVGTEEVSRELLANLCVGRNVLDPILLRREALIEEMAPQATEPLPEVAGGEDANADEGNEEVQ